MKAFLLDLKTSLLLTAVFVVLLCGVYPLAVWAGAQLCFPAKANGSLIVDRDGTVAKILEAEAATRSEELTSARREAAECLAAVAAYRTANGLAADAPVPADAVTSSGSGLDPHISVANAERQSARVARVRAVPLETVRVLIARHTEGRDLGVLGEPGVNVLLLNLALDQIPPAK